MSLVCADFLIEYLCLHPVSQDQLGKYGAIVGEPTVLLGEKFYNSNFFVFFR